MIMPGGTFTESHHLLAKLSNILSGSSSGGVFSRVSERIGLNLSGGLSVLVEGDSSNKSNNNEFKHF